MITLSTIKGSPPRYKLAKKIVIKYERGAPDVQKIFQNLGFGQVRVAQGIILHAESAKSEAVSLKALQLAARCQGMTEQKDAGIVGVNIIINTGPAPAAPGAGAPGAVQVVIAGQAQDQAPAQPRRPLQITR